MTLHPKLDSDTPQFCRVVLTGGPCGGKTTVQSILTDIFTDLKWKVFRVTEMASILLTGGVDFSELDPSDAVLFQENLLRSMLAVEKTYLDLAQASLRRGQNVLVVCDRGAMDASAFVEPEEWQQIMERVKMNEIHLRDERYDCIVHMRSAAFGTESYYTVEGHSCRRESIAEAKDRCDKALAAWMGHPYLIIIDNSTDFGIKLQRTVAAVLKRCGIPDPALPGTRRSKWLVQVTSDIPVSCQDFQVEHHVLKSTGVPMRLRKRGQSPSFVYTLAIKHPHGEQRRNLTAREYEALLFQRDPDHRSIKKTCRCFIWGAQYYHLDYFTDVGENFVLLESHHPAHLDPIIPPFITICADVTDDAAYSLESLSLIK